MGTPTTPAGRGLGLAADVVQQPTECAVSMNFIGLNDSGAAGGGRQRRPLSTASLG